MDSILCPRCKSSAVHSKLLMIGDHRSIEEQREREGGKRLEQVYADEVKEEFLSENNPRFIEGFYCESCGIGFIPSHFLKHPRMDAENGYHFLGYWANQKH